MNASSHMPLVERLRKGANCVVFLDGSPGPAADVADMLHKAADEIERLRGALKEIVNPLVAMGERAENEGAHLSGMAYQIANSVSHLQGIAKAALED